MWVVTPGRVGRGPCGRRPEGQPVAGKPVSTIESMAVTALAVEVLEGAEELAYRGEKTAREARTAPLPDDLDARVRHAAGVPHLYVHQRAAWDAAARGEHLIVTTGTASGKTLAFNLPVLDALTRDPRSRALYLYPTKALAQDQFRALNALRLPRLRPAIYDGDTPVEQRAAIRRGVIDEAHVYRGVFGSHVANVVRRLRRLAGLYGARPQFLLASATISNPGELAHALLGLPATVIGDDAAPRAERTIVLWNPPLRDAELGLRGSALAEAAKLQAGFVEQGLRTLTFAKSRKAAELV